LSAGAGQGNHLTWNADVDGRAMFVRVENGPEKDAHLAVESEILDRVRAAGVPTPLVFGCDASRSRVPFAWQALERIGTPDLNHWFKQGALEVTRIAFDIGVAVAKWQGITFEGFGPVESSAVASQLPSDAPVAKQLGYFDGCHAHYADYFHLRLDEHLAFLVTRDFSPPHNAMKSPPRSKTIVRCSTRSADVSSTKTSRFGTSSAHAIKSPSSSTSTTRSAVIRWMTCHCSPAFTMRRSCSGRLRAIKACARCPSITCAASGCICCGT
jgi:hypothetical protein